MGNRALVTFTDGGNFSPTIYLHWNGSDVPRWLETALPRFRTGDISYSAARFCGFAHAMIDGNLSLGLLDAPGEPDDRLGSTAARWTAANWADFSHGDNGVFVVNVRNWHVDRYLYVWDAAGAKRPEHVSFTLEGEAPGDWL